MHDVDDAAGRVERGAGGQGDGQVAGVRPQPIARHRIFFRLFGELRLGDALGSAHDDPPLCNTRGKRGSIGVFAVIDLQRALTCPPTGNLTSSRAKKEMESEFLMYNNK